MSKQFVENFDGQNVTTLLALSDTKEVISCTSNFRGKDYFKIQQVYKDENGLWNPGKGLSVPAEKRADLLKALIALAG